MADNLTDAQKIMRDAIGSHRYDISDYPVHRCVCGEDIGRADDVLDAHRSVAVDEALGGLHREWHAAFGDGGEFGCWDRETYDGIVASQQAPLLRGESRWVSGWTPKETPNA